jgi:2-dehydro-3-deoxyphosphooctonate aldolase (KDO 8-P synthase)
MILLAGPCVIESEESIFRIAKSLERYHNDPRFDFYFKSSLTRPTVRHWRVIVAGLEEGLRILQKVKEDFGYKIVTDVHESYQVPLLPRY